MRRIASRSLLLPALVLAVLPSGARAAGHPPVAAREGCVTRQCHTKLLAPVPVPAAGGSSAHRPAVDGDCAACHDLALAAATRFVKGAPGGPGGRTDAWDLALCAGCHDEALAARDAPPGATGFADGRRNLHALHVQAARGPRCLPCHAPHAATQPLLLRARIPARDGVVIPQEFRAEKNGGWCKTGCHAPKSYAR